MLRVEVDIWIVLGWGRCQDNDNIKCLSPISNKFNGL